MPVPKYTFLDFANEALSIVPKPLTYQELWEYGKEKGFDLKLVNTGKTPWQTLGARLFVDIRDNPESRFMKVSRNPARFFLKSRQHEVDLDDLISISEPIEEMEKKWTKEFDFHERKLHPLLAYFAYTNTSFNRGRHIYTKTIFHERSKHQSLSEWIHPDMVGFYSPIENWKDGLLELSKATNKTAIRLYSFELKKQINRSNYRENFFQAVSNSSWANEGYLVTCAVQQDDDLLSELERLSTSFGIGIIVLNLDDIDSSTVMFSARSKNYLDWETMNKLCEHNVDFDAFINDVQRDHAGKKIHLSEYDKIINEPEVYIKEMRAKK